MHDMCVVIKGGAFCHFHTHTANQSSHIHGHVSNPKHEDGVAVHGQSSLDTTFTLNTALAPYQSQHSPGPLPVSTLAPPHTTHLLVCSHAVPVGSNDLKCDLLSVTRLCQHIIRGVSQQLMLAITPTLQALSLTAAAAAAAARTQKQRR
jgi:hypothetical protein